jgi:hypothetical protein
MLQSHSEGLSIGSRKPHLDDILIYGDMLEEVQERTKRCLARLREWGAVSEAEEVPVSRIASEFLRVQDLCRWDQHGRRLTADKWSIPKISPRLPRHNGLLPAAYSSIL